MKKLTETQFLLIQRMNQEVMNAQVFVQQKIQEQQNIVNLIMEEHDIPQEERADLAIDLKEKVIRKNEPPQPKLIIPKKKKP